MDIIANPSEVSDLASFIDFVSALQMELHKRASKDFNISTVDFLEALSRYAEDIQGYYDYTGEKIDATVPAWRTFADLLKGASMYE